MWKSDEKRPEAVAREKQGRKRRQRPVEKIVPLNPPRPLPGGRVLIAAG